MSIIELKSIEQIILDTYSHGIEHGRAVNESSTAPPRHIRDLAWDLHKKVEDLQAVADQSEPEFEKLSKENDDLEQRVSSLLRENDELTEEVETLREAFLDLGEQEECC